MDKERRRMRGTEGITPLYSESIAKFRVSLTEKGVDVNCMIGFGSRVRGEARPDSDLDLAVFYDARTSNQHILITLAKFLLQSAQGRITKTEAGILHSFTYDINLLHDMVLVPGALSPIGDHVLRACAREGLVLYGQEPILWGKPLLQYLKTRVGN